MEAEAQQAKRRFAEALAAPDAWTQRVRLLALAREAHLAHAAVLFANPQAAVAGGCVDVCGAAVEGRAVAAVRSLQRKGAPGELLAQARATVVALLNEAEHTYEAIADSLRRQSPACAGAGAAEEESDASCARLLASLLRRRGDVCRYLSELLGNGAEKAARCYQAALLVGPGCGHTLNARGVCELLDNSQRGQQSASCSFLLALCVSRPFPSAKANLAPLLASFADADADVQAEPELAVLSAVASLLRPSPSSTSAPPPPLPHASSFSAAAAALPELVSLRLSPPPSAPPQPGATGLVLDTSVLLHGLPRLLAVAEDLGSQACLLIIPWATLGELDGLRHSPTPEVAEGARLATLLLEKLFTSGHPSLRGQTGKESRAALRALEGGCTTANPTGDEAVLATAAARRRDGERTLLLSNDTNLRLRARMLGLAALADAALPSTAELLEEAADAVEGWEEGEALRRMPPSEPPTNAQALPSKLEHPCLMAVRRALMALERERGDMAAAWEESARRVLLASLCAFHLVVTTRGGAEPPSASGRTTAAALLAAGVCAALLRARSDDSVVALDFVRGNSAPLLSLLPRSQHEALFLEAADALNAAEARCAAPQNADAVLPGDVELRGFEPLRQAQSARLWSASAPLAPAEERAVRRARFLCFGNWAVSAGLLSVDAAGLYHPQTLSVEAAVGAPAEEVTRCPWRPQSDPFSRRLRHLEASGRLHVWTE